MTKRYRFKRKSYGRGRFPATREGRLCIILFIIFIIWNSKRITSQQYLGFDGLMNFFPETLIAVVLLLVICYRKGEPPRRQWRGKPIKK